MKNNKINLFSLFIVFIIIFTGTFLTSCGNSNNNNEKVDFQNNKILITYFSATGNTKQIASKIQNYLSADIFEIIPTNLYSSSDLNWNNTNSRVSLEHNAFTNNDIESEYYRPAFNKTMDSLENFDIIFIGYPIWWGEAPNIIYTFLEEYCNDLKNKTIIPFCTSSSSGIGQIANHLHDYVDSSATWFTGKRFSGSDSTKTIEKWIDDLTIKN